MSQGKMTELDLFRALRPLYPKQEYALLPQTANGTGGRVTNHCDALALSLWPSRGLHLSGFEIKSYRGDWIRELKNPAKAESIAQHCNFWWIVAGDAFIKTDEVPELWGLLTYDADKKALVKVKQAKFREGAALDLAFIAAILRKAQEYVGPESELAEARDEGYRAGLEHAANQRSYDSRDLVELKTAVQKFEKASGVKISEGWRYPDRIGEAVSHILNGTVNRERDTLLRTAQRIVSELGEPA